MKKSNHNSKASSSKETTPLFPPVIIQTGPLAGMEFKVIEHGLSETKETAFVKYEAPDHGPRAVVEHHTVKGEFHMLNRAEDVRNSFSKLLPSNILWSNKSGYSDRTNEMLLNWNRQLCRFERRYVNQT